MSRRSMRLNQLSVVRILSVSIETLDILRQLCTDCIQFGGTVCQHDGAKIAGYIPHALCISAFTVRHPDFGMASEAAVVTSFTTPTTL